jgi:hypothetical protein
LDGWDLTCQRKLWISGDGFGEPSYADGFGSPSKADRAGSVGPLRIAASPRIGVTSAKDELLRFFIDGSPFVSGPRKYHSRPNSY